MDSVFSVLHQCSDQRTGESNLKANGLVLERWNYSHLFAIRPIGRSCDMNASVGLQCSCSELQTRKASLSDVLQMTFGNLQSMRTLRSDVNFIKTLR